MLITETSYAIAFYGALAVAGLAVWWLLARARAMQHPASDLPDAVVVATRRAEIKRIASKCLPFAVLALGLGAAWWLLKNEHEVLLVTQDGDDLDVGRRILLGNPRAHYVRASCDNPELPTTAHADSESVWIVNRARRLVWVEGRQYGALSFGASDHRDVIEPGTAAPFRSIDFVGPSDPPPAELTVDGVEGLAARASRWWLTWDTFRRVP